MAFRIQDLMMDVRPGGLQMANPECTCQVTVRPEIQQVPEEPLDEETEKEPEIPDDPSDGCDTDRLDALAAGLAQLRAQLRQGLGQGA